jgi:chitodextrinase
VAYDWEFGDGYAGNGPMPTHIYIEAGTYRVTLTVTDDMGATDSTTRTATIGVGNQAPTADAGGPYGGMANEAIPFDGSGSSDPEGAIVAYDWEFGDGSVGTGQNPAHAYAADGVYNVTLTVTDDVGASDSVTTAATIGLDVPPPGDDPVGDDDDPYGEDDRDGDDEDDDDGYGDDDHGDRDDDDGYDRDDDDGDRDDDGKYDRDDDDRDDRRGRQDRYHRRNSKRSHHRHD